MTTRLGALLIAITAFMASATGASAWTGCYVGANAGMAVMDTKTTLSETGFPGSVVLDGLGGTGHVYGINGGCDIKLGDSKIVVGAFGGISWFNDTEFSLSLNGPGGSAVARTGVDSSWDVGGRLGYLINNTTLGYVLLAWTEADLGNVTATNFAPTPISWDLGKVKGHQLGGGIETMLTKNISTKLEYRYSEYDSKRFNPEPGFNVDLDPTVHTITLGVSIKFGVPQTPFADDVKKSLK